MERNKDFLDFLYQCKNRDKKAWDIFVDRYSQLIYNYIIRALRRYHYPFHDDEVDDIFDNVFLALLDNNCRKLENFRGRNEGSFRAYLREITFHITVDFLRKHRKFVNFDQIKDVISDKKSRDRFNYGDLEERIFMLSDRLPERQKFLFKLIVEEGLRQSQIADRMKLKPNAVHQLKHRMINNMITFAKKKHLLSVR